MCCLVLFVNSQRHWKTSVNCTTRSHAKHMYIALQRTRRQTATGKAHVLNVPYSFVSVTLLILRLVVKCIVKYKDIAVCSVHCYWNSHAIWDHTVLRKRWHSLLYPSQIKLVLDLAISEGCRAETANLLPSQVFSKHSVTYINSQGVSTMNLSLLSLASLRGRLVEYQIRLG